MVMYMCISLRLQNQVGSFLADFQDTVADGYNVLDHKEHMKW